ncbi:uncharacterized protein LOC134250465 [Saccostrea cucullata]|uniref:uncharacterized protein LOC134250465 n=1 Tax=Saccostrea cuccullata TaxID=36930 RepID=UPI002ED30B62
MHVSRCIVTLKQACQVTSSTIIVFFLIHRPDPKDRCPLPCTSLDIKKQSCGPSIIFWPCIVKIYSEDSDVQDQGLTVLSCNKTNYLMKAATMRIGKDVKSKEKAI